MFVDHGVSRRGDIAHFRQLWFGCFDFHFGIAKLTEPFRVAVRVVNGITVSAEDSRLVFKGRLIFFEHEGYLEDVCVDPGLVLVLFGFGVLCDGVGSVVGEVAVEVVRIELFVRVLKLLYLGQGLRKLFRLSNLLLVLRVGYAFF